MGHLAKPQDASFFRVFFNPYHYGVLTVMLVKSSSIFFRKWAISYGRHTVPICGSPNDTTAGNSKKFGAELRAALLI